MKKRDVWLLLGIVVVAVGMFFLFQGQRSSTENTVAVVKKEDQEIRRIPLTEVKEPYEILIDDEFHVVLFVEHGAIQFQKSGCPDQICVKTGKISKPGQISVCMPARITVEIQGEEKEFDAVTG